jgi:hypothetical protein
MIPTLGSRFWSCAKLMKAWLSITSARWIAAGLPRAAACTALLKLPTL